VRSELSALIRIVGKVFRRLVPVLLPKLGLVDSGLRTKDFLFHKGSFAQHDIKG
jgi:hypothetical protein